MCPRGVAVTKWAHLAFSNRGWSNYSFPVSRKNPGTNSRVWAKIVGMVGLPLEASLASVDSTGQWIAQLFGFLKWVIYLNQESCNHTPGYNGARASIRDLCMLAAQCAPKNQPMQYHFRLESDAQEFACSELYLRWGPLLWIWTRARQQTGRWKLPIKFGCGGASGLCQTKRRQMNRGV